MSRNELIAKIEALNEWEAMIYNDNGYNIVLVQQLLQHSSAAVTQRYIGIRQQELEKAIEGHLMLEV